MPKTCTCSRRPLAARQHVRDQVRLRLVVLAAVSARAGDVEVAQAHGAEAGDRRAVVGDHVVDRELRLPVRVDRIRRRRLVHRHVLGDPVGRARGGEDEPRHAVLAQAIEQIERAADVRAPVDLRVRDGLADECERGEVQRAVERPERPEPGLQPGRVEQIGLDEGGAAGHRVAVSLGQVVEHDDLVADREKVRGDVAADVARASGDEQSHRAESTKNGCLDAPSWRRGARKSPSGRATVDNPRGAPADRPTAGVGEAPMRSGGLDQGDHGPL